MKQLWNKVHWSRAHASECFKLYLEPFCNAHCGLLHPAFLACTPLFFLACWLLDFVQPFSSALLHSLQLICTITFSSDSLLCQSFLPSLFGVHSLLTTCLILAILLSFSLLFSDQPLSITAAAVSASFVRQHGSCFCQRQRGH